MTQIAVRLPDEVVVGLDRLAGESGSNRSDVVRRALEAYLYRAACERDAAIYAAQPLTESEVALADDPDGWSTTAPW